jgi:hypothetical protein
MPPKRKSTDAPGPAKKSRAASPSLDEEKDPEITKILNKRWSRVSVTRNADEGFRLDNRDPVKAFTFTCFGRAPWFFPGYEDDEENDLDESDEELEDYEKEEMEEKRKNKEVSIPLVSLAIYRIWNIGTDVHIGSKPRVYTQACC